MVGQMIRITVFCTIMAIALFSTPVGISCTQQVAPTTSEVEWTLHEEPEEGYEIILPSTWRVVTEEEEQPGGGVTLIFYAVDPVSSTRVLDCDGSFSIMKVSFPQEVSLAMYANEAVKDLEADPTTVKPVSIKQVELLAGEAVEFTYTKNYPHRTGPVIFIQYAIIKDKELYVLTSETTPELIEKYKPVFEKMAQSFQLSK